MQQGIELKKDQPLFEEKYLSVNPMLVISADMFLFCSICYGNMAASACFFKSVKFELAAGKYVSNVCLQICTYL